MDVLVVQTAFLGDVVMTTPLLRELRRAHPGSRLTLVTTATGRELLARGPYVDTTLVLDKRWRPAGLASFARLAAELLRRPFDVAIAAQRSARTGQLLWLSRAPLRIGFAGAPGAWSYNRAVAWRADEHAAQRYLALSLPAGGDPASAERWPELAPDPAALRSARALLAAAGLEDRPFLCIAPGSVRATKRWTPEGFARLLALAAGDGWAAVLLGTAGEGELCRAIAEASGTRPAVLAGRTSVSEFVALIALAAGVVANDSGAGHVAAAVGTPVLSVFGPSGPEMGYGPLGRHTRAVSHPALDCRPCDPHGPRVCPLGHWRCMRELGAERVFAALRELVGPQRRTSRPR